MLADRPGDRLEQPPERRIPQKYNCAGNCPTDRNQHFVQNAQKNLPEQPPKKPARHECQPPEGQPPEREPDARAENRVAARLTEAGLKDENRHDKPGGGEKEYVPEKCGDQLGAPRQHQPRQPDNIPQKPEHKPQNQRPEQRRPHFTELPRDHARLPKSFFFGRSSM